MTTKDQLAIAELITEMYGDTSNMNNYSTDKSVTNTHEKQQEVSSIIYKNEGSAMGGSGVAMLSKMIQSNMPKRYKGSVPKGQGTTELFFYGSPEEAQHIIDTFTKQNPPNNKFNYSISLGSEGSKTSHTGQFKDPTTGAAGTLWR